MFVKLLRKVRPADKVVAAGVGVTDSTEADYYEIKDNPELNTFSAEQVEKLRHGNNKNVVERVTKMPLININRLIADNLGSAPDLLSTDIEGLGRRYHPFTGSDALSSRRHLLRRSGFFREWWSVRDLEIPYPSRLHSAWRIHGQFRLRRCAAIERVVKPRQFVFVMSANYRG
jgi:hypothetical protein